MDQKVISTLDELRNMKIIEIEVESPKQLTMENSLYLNKSKLEQYKQKKINEKCIKCSRQPKYIDNESNELYCWNHSLEKI